MSGSLRVARAAKTHTHARLFPFLLLVCSFVFVQSLYIETIEGTGARCTKNRKEEKKRKEKRGEKRRSDAMTTGEEEEESRTERRELMFSSVTPAHVAGT